MAQLRLYAFESPLAIQQGLAVVTGVGQEDTHLAVLNPPGHAAVLPCDAGRMDAFLEKASLVNHAHSITHTEAYDTISTAVVLPH